MPKYNLSGKKIWVAGHSGLVGSALMRALRDVDSEVITARHQELDLTQQTQTLDWMQTHKPDAVIIAAARVGGIAANKDEPAQFLYENLMIAANIIHSAYLVGCEKLLNLGSSCIYPKQAAQPITEEALLTGALEPTNEAYALAKISALKMTASYRAQYGCDFISAMPCNLYGIGDYYDAQRSHVIPALIMKFHAAKLSCASHVTLWGNGRALREFLFADDLAGALIYLLQHYSEAAHVNVGSGHEITIADLAACIARAVGYSGEILFDQTSPDGTMRKLLDCSQLTALGWQPQISLEEGIRLAYGDYLKRYQKQAA